MSVQHRELLGLSQFFEMMVRHNVIPGVQTNWTKDLLVHSNRKWNMISQSDTIYAHLCT